MFNAKPKTGYGWSVTRNPNKFNGDVILGLGPFKKDKTFGWVVRERIEIRLDKDSALALRDVLTEIIDE